MSINGNIYVLNYDLTPENVYKVGKTINGKQQLKNRYSTYTPIGKPNILYWCKTMDVSYTEMTILDKLSKYQMKGEWFNCPLDIIKNIIDDTIVTIDNDAESLDTISNQTDDPIETNNIMDTESDNTQTTKLCETENQSNITNITINFYDMKCERCGKEFNQRCGLYQHLGRKNPCDATFSDIEPHLLLDKVKIRKRRNYNKQTNTYHCVHCNKSYKSKTGKYLHQRKCTITNAKIKSVENNTAILNQKIEKLKQQVEKLKKKSDSDKVTNIINGNINNLNITINTCGS